MKLTAHYDSLWDQSIKKFQSGQYEYDSRVGEDNDNRYGVTLLARPSKQVKDKISRLQETLKEVSPHQYYYPYSDLHITILSIISCYPGFKPDQINPEEYSCIIQSVLDSVTPFRISFSGLTASPSCILIRGFPEADLLNNLRNGLRRRLLTSGLQHSIDSRYRLKTAHITSIRFTQPHLDEQSFLKKLTELKEMDFGGCLIDTLEFVGNDWYQQEGKTKLFKRFLLSE